MGSGVIFVFVFAFPVISGFVCRGVYCCRARLCCRANKIRTAAGAGYGCVSREAHKKRSHVGEYNAPGCFLHHHQRLSDVHTHIHTHTHIRTHTRIHTYAHTTLFLCPFGIPRHSPPLESVSALLLSLLSSSSSQSSAIHHAEQYPHTSSPS
jgi:hypothetical protein